MAFDGIMLHALTHEFNQALNDARITKITQPEPEELIIDFRSFSGRFSMLLSANASLPLIYFTGESKTNPLTAPNFCMLLRKHLANGRVEGVTQSFLERAVDITINHLDEMGDLKKKHLIVELMGKYSNIIFTDDAYVVLDAIRRVPPSVSSVRTVLPGCTYFLPETQEKKDILTETAEGFLRTLKPTDTLAKALSDHYRGISYQAACEIVYEAGEDGDSFVSSLSEERLTAFAAFVIGYVERIRTHAYCPEIAYDLNDVPVAFSAMPLSSYHGNAAYRIESFDSPSALLETYYRRKNIVTNMRQRTTDLRKVIDNLISRAVKKQDLQEKQLEDTEKRDKYRLYGELLNAYAYTLPVGEKTVRVLDYYTNTEIDIPVDETLSIADNAKRYFDRYNKLKRTYNALSDLVRETADDIEHLLSVKTALELSEKPEDLIAIREEMAASGYIRKSPGKNDRKSSVASKPHHYVSSDGFDIYVGKNNYQNDYLTFRLAENSDIWMHVKKAPGSHVIIRTGGREVPDRTYEEGGALAAYYSSLRDAEKAEIDYIEKKQVKKPAGGRPGFVIYHTNYSLIAKPDISGIRKGD